MKSNKVKISIGMPVYNGEKFIRSSLESILNQTFPYFELIISDNASTDRTKDICLEQARKDNRIKYFRNTENVGAAENYNIVFKKSSGEYFKWAAADDLIAPNFLEQCLTILEENPEVVVCYSKTKIIDAMNKVVEEYNDNLHLDDSDIGKRYLQLLQTIGECNAVFGLIRSDKLAKTSLIGNYIASDVVLLAELSLRGKFFEIPDFLFFRREHPEASSWDKSQEKQLDFFDPRTSNRITLQRLRKLKGYFNAVKNSGLRFEEKRPLYMYLIKKLYYGKVKYTKEILNAGRMYFRRLTRKIKS
ncbi:MAG TPA: glycosyltransferase family 2 protein [Bacteroidetes bacterium]|nr:glycosyltransferase family 2 protein [Bacteroidota bacterium]